MKNAEGKIVGASKIARDITERKRTEAQVAVLAREAEHRAKNILATVQATVHLSQSDTPDGLKHAIEGRIQALANVHSLFVESRWTGAELRTLVTQELAAYCREGEPRVRIGGPNVLLEPNTAQAIAVTLHELATNAAKYGALSVPDGHVHVEWSRGEDEPLVLRWTETGGPRRQSSRAKGFRNASDGEHRFAANRVATCASTGARKDLCAKSPCRREVIARPARDSTRRRPAQ